AGESCNEPAIEIDLRGNPFFAWESYTVGGEAVIQLANLAGNLASLGPGQSPDLVVDQQQNMHVFFLRDGVIHYTNDVTSAEPRTFPPAAPVFEDIPGPHTAPQAVLAGRSTIYLAFAAEGIVHLANNIPTGFSETRLIDTAVTGSPSIHIGPGNNLALSYQKDGTAYYLSGSPDDLPAPRAVIDDGGNHLAPVISTDTFGNHPVLFQRENFLMMTTNASPPAAAFSIDRLSGIAPMDIHLRDESEGDITAWLWTFGDGTVSVLSDPGHTYPEVGEYEINLTVIGPGGRSSTGLDQAIEVTESPNRIWVDDVRVFPGMESVYIPVELAHDVPVQA
ncbi:MAG: PKD domain-containing protein, partial [Planctomycetes bacterium]|nr:PKD domain-containing protein [Planctomycetota bacterium]